MFIGILECCLPLRRFMTNFYHYTLRVKIYLLSTTCSHYGCLEYPAYCKFCARHQKWTLRCQEMQYAHERWGQLEPVWEKVSRHVNKWLKVLKVLKESENSMTVKHLCFTITTGLHWCIYWNKFWCPCVIWLHMHLCWSTNGDKKNNNKTSILVFKQLLKSVSVGLLWYTTTCFFHFIDFSKSCNWEVGMNLEL